MLLFNNISETLKECGLQAFMGAIGAVEASGGKFFSAGGMGGTPLPGLYLTSTGNIWLESILRTLIWPGCSFGLKVTYLQGLDLNKKIAFRWR